MDCVLPEFKQAIDEHVAMLEVAFQCPIATPWQDTPPRDDSRHLQRELLSTHLAALAARQLTTSPAISVDVAVSTAQDTVAAQWPRGFDDRGVADKARRLLLRAQARAVARPANLPAPLCAALGALDARWRAVSATLEGFANELEAIVATHGAGLALSASGARSRQAEVDRAGYDEVRAVFLTHFAPGRTQLTMDDGDLRDLLLDRTGDAPSLFSPWLAFSMLHAQFAASAHDRLAQQVADALVKALGLRTDEEPKLVSGHVVVSRSAWIDAFDKAHLGRTRYTYSCREGIQSTLSAIADAWPHLQPETSPDAIEAELKQALSTLEAANWSPSRTLRPRLMGIELRCFQGTVEFWMPDAIAGEINAFVTEHSSAFSAQRENG